MSADGVVVGIDVSKATLDEALTPGTERWRAGNEAVGIAEVVARLTALRPGLIVLEATGGYERAVVAALAAAVLARFGAQVRPVPRPLPDEQAQALDARLTRRRQLLEMLTAEKNRLAAAPVAVRRGITQHIRWLER